MSDLCERLGFWEDHWPCREICLEAKTEIERLLRFLEIAVDAYEDVATDPNIGKPGHFTTQARKLLGHVQSAAASKEAMDWAVSQPVDGPLARKEDGTPKTLRSLLDESKPAADPKSQAKT